MLKDSAKGLFDAVIVWKIDRFGRNREEIAINKVKLRRNGVRVMYAKEHIPDGPEGIILESTLEGLAEYYSANLSQNIMRGMRGVAMKGQSTGGGVIHSGIMSIRTSISRLMSTVHRSSGKSLRCIAVGSKPPRSSKS